MSLMNIIMHTTESNGSISAGTHHVNQLILQVLQTELCLHVKHQMQTTHMYVNGMN